MAEARKLRIVTAATFVPALPLCIASGVLSSEPLPAVGLVPLAFSAAAGVFLTLQKQTRRSRHRRHGSDRDVERAASVYSSSSSEAGHESLVPDRQELARGAQAPPEPEYTLLTHPIVVFLADAVLAAAIMAVLVCTWISVPDYSRQRPQLAILGTYATFPLLTNFIIHLYLALSELAAGLALKALVQRAAWQAVPPNCPHCGERVRPDRLPTIPWAESVSAPTLPPFPNISVPRLSITSVKLPAGPSFNFKGPSEWTMPAWLTGQKQDQGYAPLLVSQDAADPDDDVDHGAYRASATSTAGPSYGAIDAGPAESASPVVEAVVVGKNKKGKSTSSLALIGDE
ncbi:hypothetical protein B0T26DRAFT_747912 [Lasiosphaeria miniovina]|uniref:Uncharacterized protein n=1 Tax=Lasiosphaeria miniovina TaxID=1954250 RepID=A0AA40B4K4_9PEZI|nr:uncharacterized protein B0T26DRAFT_747912 [Lasiosphaeria miniovina]KAK0727600.1 hypothetical protein B0T26DRAFT_747912 [Lasiosphaeria miniovina]